MAGRKWTREEKRLLRELWEKESAPRIAHILGRSPGAVWQKARELGLSKKYRRLTEQEKEFIRANCTRMSPAEMARYLGRHASTVKYYRDKVLKLPDIGWKGLRFKYLLKDDPYTVLDETTKAYIAGIVDGEGCIRKNTSRSPNRPYKYKGWRVAISNTSWSLIEWLENTLFNASITCKNHKSARHRECWAIYITGDIPVYLFLRSLLPYLIVKKQQALEAIRDIESRYPELRKEAVGVSSER